MPITGALVCSSHTNIEDIVLTDHLDAVIQSAGEMFVLALEI